MHDGLDAYKGRHPVIVCTVVRIVKKTDSTELYYRQYAPFRKFSYSRSLHSSLCTISLRRQTIIQVMVNPEEVFEH